MANSNVDSSTMPGIGKHGKGILPATTAKKASTLIPETTAKKPAPVKKRLKTTGKKSKTVVTAEQRHQMIAVVAYYRAEMRGFQCKCCEQDWFDAAAEIDRIL